MRSRLATGARRRTPRRRFYWSGSGRRSRCFTKGPSDICGWRGLSPWRSARQAVPIDEFPLLYDPFQAVSPPMTRSAGARQALGGEEMRSAIHLPVVERLRVLNYPLYPGANKQGLDLSFDKGVTVIAGINGIGKKSVYSMRGASSHSVLAHLRAVYTANPNIPINQRPHYIHIAGQYFIIRTKPGLVISSPGWSTLVSVRLQTCSYRGMTAGAFQDRRAVHRAPLHIPFVLRHRRKKGTSYISSRTLRAPAPAAATPLLRTGASRKTCFR